MDASTSATPTSGGDLRTNLLDEHAGHERLFERMLEASAARDHAELRYLWTELERALEDHMRGEEEQLLPIFRQVDPREAAAILDQHERLRRLLVHLGAAVDLHALDPKLADEFVAAMRDHARREDALFYRWAVQEHDARRAS